jgi:hypothetical protein
MTAARWQGLVVGLVCLAGLAWGLRGRRQTPGRPAEPAKGKSVPTPLFYGVFACNLPGCHNQEKALQEKDRPLLCRGIESQVWSKGKHADAYNILTQDRAKRMARLLGTDVTSSAGGCIGCHAAIVPKGLAHPSFKLSEGVSCVVCHGAYKEWYGKHSNYLEQDQWRDLARSDKESQFGMTDLWDPVRRAKLCISCHVGNVVEGKVMTHAMYAAGHPPLPGIEVATFCEKMPRHWELIRKKTPDVQKLLRFSAGSEEFEQTKVAVASGVITFRDTMRLLAQLADKCSQLKGTEAGVLDLANFDCYACHHDLKSPSWRQKRGFGDRPGRPQMRSWPTALVRLGVLVAGGSEAELNNGLKELSQAFAAQPFGDCRKIKAATSRLATWANQVADALKDAKLDRAKALQLLRQLCTAADREVPDYDSARQIAWAFEIIYWEWKPVGGIDPKFQEAIQPLKEELNLDLPTGHDKEIIKELPKSLEKLNDYNPDTFKANFQRLSALLPAAE